MLSRYRWERSPKLSFCSRWYVLFLTVVGCLGLIITVWSLKAQVKANFQPGMWTWFIMTNTHWSYSLEEILLRYNNARQVYQIFMSLWCRKSLEHSYTFFGVPQFACHLSSRLRLCLSILFLLFVKQNLALFVKVTLQEEWSPVLFTRMVEVTVASCQKAFCPLPKGYTVSGLSVLCLGVW